MTYETAGLDHNFILMQGGSTFVIAASSVLCLSYLVIRVWRNRPSSLRMWFWVGMASVTLGILSSSWQILTDMTKGQAYTLLQSLSLMLIWSVILFIGLLILFSFGTFFRWLFSWRILKRVLLALVVLLVLVATFYAEENWRGKRAWENYRREWEAKGEKFDLLSFAPPAVPDEQNFAMAPIVVSGYTGRMNRRDNEDGPTKSTNVNQMAMELHRTNLIFETNVTIGSWQRAKLTDLKAWQDYYRTMRVTNRWEMGMPGMPPMMLPGMPPPPGGIRSAESNSVESATNEEVQILATDEFPIAPQPQSPAADVLLALSRYDQAIVELREAGARPYSRFPLDYQIENPAEIPLRHLGGLKQSAIVLQLRAVAELQAGKAEEALADVKLILRLAESIRSEPLLISHLTRLSLINLTLQPVWEGLAEHRWADAQLQELNRELQKLDAIAEFRLSLHGELATSLGYMEHSRKHRGYESIYFLIGVWPTAFEAIDRNWRYLPDLPKPLARILEAMADSLPDEFISRCVVHLPPDGWYELNKVTLAKIYQERLFPIAQPEKHLISQQTAAEINKFTEQARQQKNLNPQNVLALMGLPAITSAAQRIALGQNAIDLAIVACALERYHLASGDYPETLALLTPEYVKTIPPDVVDGQPLHYRRTQKGRYILYSIGWNGQDDGGVVGLNDYGRVDVRKGDWVWQYPAQKANNKETK